MILKNILDIISSLITTYMNTIKIASEFIFSKLVIISSNATISSAIGAILAYHFMLLLINRKKRMGKKFIIEEIKNNKQIATDKKTTVERKKAELRERRFSSTRTIKFSADEIEKIKLEHFNLFNEKERLALNAVCFRMRVADDLLEEMRMKTQKIIEMGIEEKAIPNHEISQRINGLLDDLTIDHDDVIRSLSDVEHVTKLFLENKLDEILGNNDE